VPSLRPFVLAIFQLPEQLTLLRATGPVNKNRDYILTSGTLQFATGEASKSFTLLLVDNAFIDGNRTVNIALSNSTGGVSLANPNTATLTIFDNDSVAPTSNPLDNGDALFFVRQHYLDFLGREPDTGGLGYWSDRLRSAVLIPPASTIGVWMSQMLSFTSWSINRLGHTFTALPYRIWQRPTDAKPGQFQSNRSPEATRLCCICFRSCSRSGRFET